MTISSLHMGLLRQAVPERAAELEALLREANIQIEQASDRPGFQLETGFGAIIVGNRTPAICWIIADAAWHCIAAFAPGAVAGATDSGTIAKMPAQMKYCGEVSRRLEAARELQKREDADSFKWPEGIPSPGKAAELIQDQALRDITQLAWAFMLLHEVKHAHLSATGGDPMDAMDEERSCDRFAIGFLLEGVGEYAALRKVDVARVRALRSMGIMTALFAVAVLGRDNDGVHPPAAERLKSLFDVVGDRPSGYFWLYALVLMMGAIHARGDDFSVAEQSSNRAAALELVGQLS